MGHEMTDNSHAAGGDAPQGQPPLYWSTLEQYHQTPDYKARRGEEFYPDAKPEKFFDAVAKGEDPSVLETPLERRTFLKLGGFAAVLAALQGCERPVQKILPYVTAPEEIIPGVPVSYATSCLECAAGCGVLSTNRDGRPIKLEGNKQHAVNKGSLCAKGQASLLQLYNPDRGQFPAEIDRSTGKAIPVEFEAADARIAQALKATDNKIVLLTGTMHGPTRARLMADFARAFPKFEHVTYEPLNSGLENDLYRAAYGIEAGPRYLFDRAQTVVLLGGDPIGQGISRNEYQRGIAERRTPDERMSRIYAFEPVPTISGAFADYRFRVNAASLVSVGLAIAGEIGVRGLPTVSAGDAESAAKLPAGTIAKVAARLREHAGKGIVYCESTLLSGEAGRALAAVCLAINDHLGNVGSTIDITASPSHQMRGSSAAMARLMEDMREGRVGALLTYNVNPAYTLPNREEFAKVLKGVPLVVSLGMKLDETGLLGDYHLPSRHWLECWGDTEPQKGLFGVMQPMIELPWKVRQFEESLIALATAAGSDVFIREIPHPDTATDEEKAKPLAKRPATMREYLRETWAAMHKQHDVAAGFEEFWNSFLRVGIFDRADAARRAEFPARPALKPAALAEVAETPRGGEGMSLVLYASNVHGDGESMSNPFLIELPDAMTKVAWDNYAGLSPATAQKLGVEEGDWVSLADGDAKVEAPVWVWPGVEDDTVALMLGWGRTNAGDVGLNTGVDAFPMARIDGATGTVAFAGRRVKVSQITDGLAERNDVRKPRLGATNPSVSAMLRGSKYPFANTQGHNYLEGRPIFFETTLAQLNTPDFDTHIYAHWYTGKQKNDFINAWGQEHKYAGHHWGMVIDYNKCTGCNACLVACQAENNIPVVGKLDIIKGREMHWIRIDRYYRGHLDNPDHVYQPMLCQHCGTAPCETVCPVVATLHNDEGLNTMIYNRCVGTRYCLNNCPYKVRRFNWHQYSDYRTGFHDNVKRVSPLELALNPDVGVRSRGVMEKCTFCVHKIKRAKEASRTRGTPLVDGDMQTACQLSCPSHAITFGDRNDPNSELMKVWNDKRAQGVLADLNTQPGVRYLTLVRNRDEKVPAEYLGEHGGAHHGGGHDEHDSGHGAGEHAGGDHAQAETAGSTGH